MVLRSLMLLGGDASRSAPAAAPDTAKWHPGHYVFVGQGQIRPEHLSEHFRGVQKLYTWSALEPAEGRYDFAPLRHDLAILQAHGKQLVLQVQYKAFGTGQRRVPAYVQGSQYGGGVYLASSGSYDPVIWNARVGQRMDALFAALGREFDGEPAVEAVVLPETSPSAALEAASLPTSRRTTPCAVRQVKLSASAVFGRRPIPTVAWGNAPGPHCHPIFLAEGHIHPGELGMMNMAFGQRTDVSVSSWGVAPGYGECGLRPESRTAMAQFGRHQTAGVEACDSGTASPTAAKFANEPGLPRESPRGQSSVHTDFINQP